MFGNIQYHSGTQIFASFLSDSVPRSDLWSRPEIHVWPKPWLELMRGECGVEKGIFLEGEKSKENFKYFLKKFGNKFLFEYFKIPIGKEFFWWLEPNVDVVIILNKSQKSEVKSLCILTYTLNCMETIFQKLF